ncbi:MAG: tetratricopeptide repeat protein [Anaerolineaceae bacterium]|nr:MAG: tetratricopeptide repeat protein [Anaerolineaceae bacterium]
MYVKRDYQRSFFNKAARPRRHYGRWLFLLGLLVGGVALYISANFSQLELQAQEFMGTAPTATPLPADLAMLGSQLAVTGDLTQARDLFERAIEQRPNNIAYRYEYGRLMIEMNQPTITREQGEAIISLNADDPRGYALRAMAEVSSGNPNSAIPFALNGLELNAGYESHLYTALARAYTNSGQYVRGVEAGEMAIISDPTDANARRAYAYALSWVRQNEAAIEQLEAAILLDPNNISAYMELALHYLAQNRDQEAINIYDRVLAIQPRNARAMRRLCGTYRKIGQFERAIGFCEDAVEADPTAQGAWYELGLLQYNAYRMESARDSFAACVELDPSSYACKHRLGLAYYYLEECTLAWDTLQDSLLLAQIARGQGEDVSGVLDNIQVGLQAVTRDCPEYRGLMPSVEEIEPEELDALLDELDDEAPDGESFQEEDDQTEGV